MDFSFTEEQNLIRQSLQSYLQDNYHFEARRQASLADGWRPEIWKAFAEDLGITAMTLPERVGGMGMDAVSTMLVMEEFGRSLVLEPYLETVVICGGMLARAGGATADETLAKIAAGERIVAFAWGEPNARYDFKSLASTATANSNGWLLNGKKSVVMAAPWASHLLVTARTSGEPGDSSGISLFLLDKASTGIRISEYPTIDGRRAADVEFNNVQLGAEALIGDVGEALANIEQAGDEAIAALSAEAVGVMSVLHEDTVAYTKQRKQFGQPISNFQALQHRMVDMYMEIEMARSAAYLVTLNLSSSINERAIAASAAKVAVSKACRFVGQNAVQLHGGMGMTDELAISHYFKRATLIESEFGSADYHLMRHAALRAS